MDDLAIEVLTAVKTLIEKTKYTYNYLPQHNISKFLVEMNVVVSLTEIILNSHLKRIKFSDWPKIMRLVLYRNLSKLDKLEVLNLGSCTGGWRTSEYDKWILDGISVMTNLRTLCLCFDCTDLVLQVLCDNCPNIQCLDVTSSRSVTDRSVPYLLKCVQLKELQMHRTSVTIEGLADLLIGLPKIQDIGKCDEFGAVIKRLHLISGGRGPFALKKIHTRDLSTEHLRIFVDMFPNIEHVTLFKDNEVCDLTILSSLDLLEGLKLLSCAYYGDYVKQLLEVRGENITKLHLEHVEEMDLKALINISQNCPHLKSLVMYNCDFVADVSRNLPYLKVNPFQNLERLFWMVDCSVSYLEFILSHSTNIKYIHLGSSTGITHSTVENILSVNPMEFLEELKILFSSDMNMQTVNILLNSCKNLKILSELENWQGITEEELEDFKKYICINNFDLDIRPTLSYY